MMVEGVTEPAVAGATVRIQRKNQLSLKDRVPTFVETDEQGRFKHGPVHKDSYSVEITKEGYVFHEQPGEGNRFSANR